jgi:transcriptional regulator with XRE-family HTH domain
MPRKPSQPHALRAVREILELSQEELAKKVGCSTSMIQQIELGKKKPSKDLAFKIQDATGIDPRRLMRGDKNFFVTKESYEAFKNLR